MIGLTTHSKIIAIAASQTSSVTLTDPAGRLIDCNYLSVTCSEANSSPGYVLVVPSAVSNFSSIALGNGASGTYSYVMTPKETLNIILGHSRICKAVSLTNSNAGTRNIIITYGIAHDVNSLRAGIRNPGLG